MKHPFLAIIHSIDDHSRYNILMKELEQQGIYKYMLFPSVYHPKSAMQGINLAHRQCIEYAKIAEFPEILIMEDDIRFTSPKSFEYFLNQKPNDFDIYLGGVYVSNPNADGTLHDFCGFHCYIVKADFYDTYLSVPYDEHIDRAMSGKGKFILCDPMIAIQHSGYSHNTKRHETYENLLVGKNLYNG
jgi:hypothetical protein